MVDAQGSLRQRALGSRKFGENTDGLWSMNKAQIKGEELLRKLVMHKKHQKRKKVFVSTEESRRTPKKGGETSGNREETPKKIGEPFFLHNAGALMF